MSRTLRYILASLVVLVLLAGAFSGGLLIGWVIPDNPLASLQPQESPSASVPQIGGESKNKDDQGGALFAPFWQAWDLIHQQYVDQPVDDITLMRGAIHGMLESLGDEHTSFMDPTEYKQVNEVMQGEYGGIGAYVDATGEFLTITSPMPGSPAQEAGLKPGDAVIKVDGEDMTGVDGSLVLKRVKGEPGTDVTLTIQREGQEPFDVTITRELISIPSVTQKMLDNNIGYIQLTAYGDNSANDFQGGPQNPDGPETTRPHPGPAL